jgi:hypothetical protein
MDQWIELIGNLNTLHGLLYKALLDRMYLDSPEQREIYKTYKTFAEADKAAKQFITQQTLEPGRKREKDSRTDDREEEYQEKKPKVEQYVEKKRCR